MPKLVIISINNFLWFTHHYQNLILIILFLSGVVVCDPNPCQHNGKCEVLSSTKFHCDCSSTGYKGEKCEIGIVKVPELPRMELGNKILKRKNLPFNMIY